MSIGSGFRILAVVTVLLGPASVAFSSEPGAIFSTPDEASSVAALSNRIAALSPKVRRDEAQQLAACAYKTSRQLAKEYRVVWPPGLQNFFIHTGIRKRGYCFQWAEDMLARLALVKMETLELHWGEAFPNTTSEHNNIVVTAKGQPFRQGLLLDCWRYGRLVCIPLATDSHYVWKENQREFARKLPAAAGKRSAAARVASQDSRDSGESARR